VEEYDQSRGTLGGSAVHQGEKILNGIHIDGRRGAARAGRAAEPGGIGQRQGADGLGDDRIGERDRLAGGGRAAPDDLARGGVVLSRADVHAQAGGRAQSGGQRVRQGQLASISTPLEGVGQAGARIDTHGTGVFGKRRE
jgi:hypothetical protein